MSEQLQAQYNAFKSSIQDLTLKIQELKTDSEEHRIVLESLAQTDGERNCKRMIGTVLVDKKVKDVIPALEETLKGLEKAIETLKEDLKSTETRMDQWKKEHNIKVVSS
ncbi:tubulin-binding prefolding complex subunit [Starmerella bacillaris]|uniref:Tubulin-binding prefolding complex subunit n=1 Tax=Starmerella bacillaris TaxID=1247836 RepID=A0AAV5REA5_STABA|nr:tubulin-binding prefolding complex subunit [Starmerella bacillaris]